MPLRTLFSEVAIILLVASAVMFVLVKPVRGLMGQEK
jgi:hypothetical protein